MKRVLIPILALLVLFVLPPAMAKSIGPRNAENNPNVTIMPDGTIVLHTPGGVQNEWRYTEDSVMDLFHMLDASKFENRKARVFTVGELVNLLTNPEAALEFEHKWGYMSHSVLETILELMGYSPQMAEEIAAMWPEGLYFMYVNVGK